MRGNWIFSKILQIQAPASPPIAKKEQGESVLIGLGHGESCDGEGWKLVTFGTKRKPFAPPADLQLQLQCLGIRLGAWELSKHQIQLSLSTAALPEESSK